MSLAPGAPAAWPGIPYDSPGITTGRLQVLAAHHPLLVNEKYFFNYIIANATDRLFLPQKGVRQFFSKTLSALRPLAGS